VAGEQGAGVAGGAQDDGWDDWAGLNWMWGVKLDANGAGGGGWGKGGGG
jgi:hypothetical protein